MSELKPKHEFPPELKQTWELWEKDEKFWIPTTAILGIIGIVVGVIWATIQFYQIYQLQMQQIAH